MAKQALIICAGGMSSSMIAKKTMALLQEQGEDIEMDAVGVPEGQKRIEADNYDLYLVQIPPQAYVPIPMGIEKMAKLVKENI